ncbi:MAG: DUF2270 domain-containing protein [Anaerolineales bacterium]|nr:DUF2270 domain-containing protein [Anaerolineales bacterium]
MMNKEDEYQDPDEPIWSFRGYKLNPGHFTTAMVHFFRAEVTRANVWRRRLDETTNWAVITTGAVISFAFTQPESHLVILLDLALVTLFLWVEARRYRYYELWSYRVRLMETDFIAPMLVPPFHPSEDWAESLAESLLHPTFPISELEALGRRLRRNYLWIYGIVGISWLAKLAMFPEPADNLYEIMDRADLAWVSGYWVFLLVGLFYMAIFLLGLVTVRLQQASGEVLPRFGLPESFFDDSQDRRSDDKRAWFRPSKHRKQRLTFIITEKPKDISEAILKEMRRGATIVPAKGAFSGADRTVLMCALFITEIPQLRALVAKLDKNAFVTVVPARNVYGGGFSSLERG